MQHLWFTERVDRHRRQRARARSGRGAEAELRQAPTRFPWTTPNGCVYDSGDYARCLDIALELVGYDGIEERRRDAEVARQAAGDRDWLDARLRDEQLRAVAAPESDLQFSGNNEVATVKLDIFGEVVVTLGTVPQGQGHETTAAQVVADALGISPDDVTVRPGHDTYWNSHAGFSGTYA